MSERTNGQRKMNGDGVPEQQGSFDGVHATEEQLSALLDGEMATAERAGIERHVATCPICQAQLAELRGLATMLRALPAPRPQRSFQLGPEHLRSNDAIWTKLAAWLLPALPALRAGTVAIALLLAAVSIRNIVDDPAARGPVADAPVTMQTAAPTMTTVDETGQNTAALQTNQQTEEAPDVGGDAAVDGETQESFAAGLAEEESVEEAAEPADDAMAETDEVMVADEPAAAAPEEAAGGRSAKDAPAGDAAGASTAQDVSLMPAEEDAEAADEAAEADENMAMVAMEPASPTASPSPSTTPPPTATPSPTATFTPPTPQPTPTEAPVAVTAATEGDEIGGWEAVQLFLAVALILMIAVVLLLGRARRQFRTSAR